MTQPARWTIGIDTGGTFTDIVVLGTDGSQHTSKAPTTPGDFATGVMNAIAEAARTMGISVAGLLAATTMVKHGSTVATNALIVRGGVKVGFITTRGFEDTPLIGRSIARTDGLSEDEIKHTTYVTKPEPMVPRRLIRGVSERIDYTGDVLLPLNVEETKQAIRELVEQEAVSSIAVSLMQAWANPAHERQIKELVQELSASGEIYWSFGSELAQLAGEYARANTAIANAYVGPIVTSYLSDLDRRLRENGFRGNLLVMQGNGGLAGRDQVTPLGNLQSGPAGGMIASAFAANALGHRRVLTTDMGGTSFDVSMLIDGDWAYAEEPVFERIRMLQPIVHVESIGAGGGTIARVDEVTGRLLVGPKSAGGRPGPACYGEGGTEATVTDADVVLGLVNPDYFLGGQKWLDRELAERTIAERVAKPLNLGVVEAAGGIYEIINNKMSDLIRAQLYRSGYLPEEFVLYAFGGAGPVHAVGFARELGIREIYVFPTSSVFSAFGCAMADVIHAKVLTTHYPLPFDPADMNARLEEVDEELLALMEAEGFARDQVRFRRFVSMRFRRQSQGVEVRLPWDRFDEATVHELADLFERRYDELYGAGAGFRRAGIDLNTIRVDAIGPVPKPEIRSASGGREPAGRGASSAQKAVRPAYFGDRFVDTPIYDYDRLGPGDAIAGPGIVESPFTTIVVPPGACAEVDEYLNIVIRL